MSWLTDEFADLAGIACGLGRTGIALPDVRRQSIDVDGKEISFLRWGDDRPEVLFLHGGGQNAHTWDKVALLLGRPALAIDLPGHGRSAWRDDRDYWPWRNAQTLGQLLPRVADNPLPVVGMSLGGLTAIRLASSNANLVEALVIVDVTPGVMARTRTTSNEDRGTTRLIGEPTTTFTSQEEMVSVVRTAAPHRPEADIRRGVRHNSRPNADGSWRWRYDRMDPSSLPGDFAELWTDLESVSVPTMLVLGADSSFVGDRDVAEFRSRIPDAQVHRVENAGHSVQSDQPAALAALLQSFLPGAGRSEPAGGL